MKGVISGKLSSDLMDPHDVQNLRRVVSKHRKTNASNSNDPGQSTNAPKAKVSEGGSKVPDVHKSLSFTKKRVQTFLWAA